MAEDTLHFDDPRNLESLYVNDPRNLHLIEDRLDVRLNSRGGCVKISGRLDQIDKARRLFGELSSARGQGVAIRQHDFVYALNLVAQGDESQLNRMLSDTIRISPKKPPVVPKTLGQERYLGVIRENSVVLAMGPAGTGKTYLAVAMALQALREGRADRIILTRPAVEAGESLGFLPGDLQEKLLPYLRPLYDALYDMMDLEEVQRLMDRGTLEIAPLAYMRGRTLHRCFAILDEGQNASCEQMFMFLTRLGQESKCVVTGDPTQIDLPHSRKSGLIEAIQALGSVAGVGIHEFGEGDVVRHEIVQRVIAAYRDLRGNRKTSLTL
ncbi:MAG TPA: PhoH family protein [Verrucomicrobiae bacterium]|nr:PhoH family protein [Verrucomicrobiae bacterium]